MGDILFMETLGQRLKILRIHNNLTQNQLARKLSVSKSVISAYENSQRMPSYDILIHLARLFKVSTDYLLGIENARIVDLSGLSEVQTSALTTIIHSMKSNHTLQH